MEQYQILIGRTIDDEELRFDKSIKWENKVPRTMTRIIFEMVGSK
jgi:hypothetical protein